MRAPESSSLSISHDCKENCGGGKYDHRGRDSVRIAGLDLRIAPFPYGLPTTGILLLAASLRLSDARKIRLGSATLTIYTIEAVHTFLESRIFLELASGKEFDNRSRVEVVQQLRRDGRDAVPVVCPAATFLHQGRQVEIDSRKIGPLAGISKAATVLCNESGEYTIYESDEHGFNNPQGLFSLDQIEVAALGDSFVHGGCVAAGKDIVALLRQAFPRTLNLGLCGNRPLMELASFREYAKSLRQAVVLWFYYEGNELTDLTNRTKGCAADAVSR